MRQWFEFQTEAMKILSPFQIQRKSLVVDEILISLICHCIVILDCIYSRIFFFILPSPFPAHLSPPSNSLLTKLTQRLSKKGVFMVRFELLIVFRISLPKKCPEWFPLVVMKGY